MHDLIQSTIKAHRRILFNGNGYDDAWIEEATEKRGLLNLRTTPDALPRILDPKNVAMLTGHKVFSEAEIESRCEIMLDNYRKTVHIEAQTMIDMARKQILPAVESYAAKLAETLATKKALSPLLGGKYETSLLTRSATSPRQPTSSVTKSCRRWTRSAPRPTRPNASPPPNIGRSRPTAICYLESNKNRNHPHLT